MKIIYQDLRRGLIQNRWRWVLTLIVIFFLVGIFFINIDFMVKENGIQPGMWDVVLYILKGMKEYIPGKEKFTLPYVWISIQFLCSFNVFNLIDKNLESYGLNILMRCRNRRKWWISKCVTGISMVFLVYFTIYIVAFLSSLLAGGGINFTAEYYELLTGMPYDSKMSIVIKIFLLIAPLLTSITSIMMQLFMELIMGSVYSVTVILAIYVFSAYFMESVLIGNYSMLLRSNLLLESGGMSPCEGVLAEIAIIIVLVILGAYFFQNKDIFKG